MSASRVEHLAEGVELWLGDCREVLPLLPPVGVVLTDPPYAVSVKGAANKSPRGTRRLDFFTGDDDWESMNCLVREAIEKSLALEPRSFAAWCGHRQVGFITQLIESYGMSSRLLGWKKSCPPPSAPGAGFASALEVCVYGYLPGRYWGGGQYDASVYECDSYRHGQPGKVDHPTQKPLQLFQWLVERIAAPGETVCDPFSGSGTTGVACVKTARRFIGIEREPKYFDIACRRISEALKSPDLFIPAPKPKATQESLDV
jgi:site-specific DNA-methyltransferase (adenine-specific)